MGKDSKNILEVKNIEVVYDNVILALHNVSLDVPRGKIVALLGANGAGKSTLVKIISGLVPIDVGTIKFEGNDRTRANIREIQNSGVALIHQEPRLFPDLSVLENVCVDYQVRASGSRRFNWKKAEEETEALLKELGCTFSIHSPVKALSVADQFIKTGMYKNILVIGSELQSHGIDKSTRGRSISVIFGDGAGAAILTREEDLTKGILSTHIHSEGKHALELATEAPGMGTRWVSDIIKDNDPKDFSYRPYMNGQFVFKHAIKRFSEVINEGLQKNNLEVSDIDMLIPHQANLRISQFIQKKFGLSDDQVYNNIQKYGNTTAASIPIALSEAHEQGKVKSGDTVVLAAFGSGFTWGSVIIKW